MKRVLFSLLLCLVGMLSNAQLQLFTDPDFGRFDPKFLHQGYLVGNNYTENPQTGNYDVFNGIHKVNLSSGETTQFSFGEQGVFEMPFGVDTRSTHQDNIYVSFNGFGFRKISLSENYVYDNLVVGAYQIVGTIFGNRIYFNWYTYGTHYYDILTGDVIFLGNVDAVSGPLFHSLNVLDNNIMIGLRFLSLLEGQQGSRLLKIGAGYGVVDYIESSLNSEGEGDYISGLHAFPPNGQISVNGREIFIAQMHTGANRLISIDPNNFQSTNFISDYYSINDTYNYIILPDGVIFMKNGNFYKTNGSSSLEQISSLNNLGNFNSQFHTPSPYNLFRNTVNGNSFVQVGNVTYFKTVDTNYVERVYKMTSINATPELIFSSTVEGTVIQLIQYATEWNGNLLFVVQDNDSNTPDIVYLYNGTELIVNPDLNTYVSDAEPRQMANNDNVQPSITGLLSYGDLLLVNTNQGVYAIEHDEVLSIADSIPLHKLQIYPNPVNDILNLSEKVKEVSVYNLSGRVVKAQAETTDQIDISALSKGTYLIKGTTETGKKFVNKIIKN